MEPIDHEKLLAELDRESAYRTLKGPMQTLITTGLILFSVFQIYISITVSIPAQVQRMTHLGFIICLAFWLFPITKKASRTKMSWVDMALGLGFVVVAIYYIINFRGLIDRSGAFNTMDVVFAAIGIVLILEACRRVVGWPIVIIATLFIAYGFFGKYIPGFMNHRGFSFTRIVSHLFYTTEGVMGMPINVCVRFVFLFILFGSFLEKTGIGQFFIDLANAVAGFAVGGPAKVAVLTSALQGMISGSSVSNTVTTGSFTIPLMKSLGYKPEFAGAVEAAASTGGQIMPPIMGAAAFLIAETVGVSYMEVAKAAIIPAVLYFTGIWIMVHLEAKKLGLKGMPKDQLPKIGPLLKEKWHLLIPIFVIIGVMLWGKTAQFAALSGIASAIIVPYLRKSTRVPLRSLGEAFVSGARNMISVSCACGVAGMIVGIVTLTGLGLKLGDGLLSFAGSSVLLVLFFTMITSIILGMGVPTTANYLITSTIVAPIILRLTIPGTDVLVPALAAHLFAFYFGIVADITPPVALAAYAGSAIAKGNPFKTGVTATRLAIAAFIIPYLFVLNPALILIDTTWYEVIQITISAVFGMFGISAAMSRWVYGKTAWWEQILLIAGGGMMLYPGIVTDILGSVVVIIVILLQRTRYKPKTIAA